jgi:hypothetical protein
MILQLLAELNGGEECKQLCYMNVVKITWLNEYSKCCCVCLVRFFIYFLLIVRFLLQWFYIKQQQYFEFFFKNILTNLRGFWTPSKRTAAVYTGYQRYPKSPTDILWDSNKWQFLKTPSKQFAEVKNPR